MGKNERIHLDFDRWHEMALVINDPLAVDSVITHRRPSVQGGGKKNSFLFNWKKQREKQINEISQWKQSIRVDIWQRWIRFVLPNNPAIRGVSGWLRNAIFSSESRLRLVQINPRPPTPNPPDIQMSFPCFTQNELF